MYVNDKKYKKLRIFFLCKYNLKLYSFISVCVCEKYMFKVCYICYKFATKKSLKLTRGITCHINYVIKSEKANFRMH